MRFTPAVAAVLASLVLAVGALSATPVSAAPVGAAPPSLLSGASPLTADRCKGRVPSEIESFPWLAVRPGAPRQRTAVWLQDGPGGVVTASTANGANWRTSVPDPLVTCALDATDRVTEPRVAITPSGVVYATAFTRDDATTTVGRTVVVRSDDAGATWSAVSRPDDGLDPLNDFDAIAVEPDQPDVLLVLWSQPEVVGEPTVLSRSTDGGRTWTRRPVRLGVPGTASWSRVVALGDGRLAVVYQDAPLAEIGSPVAVPGPIFAMTSADHGSTWSLPVLIGDGAAFQWPSVAAGPAGELYVSWVRRGAGPCRRFTPDGSEGGDCRAVVARSLDGGATWGGAATVLGWKGPWMPSPAVAVAGNGTVGLVATVPVDGGRARTDLAHSHDCGATWERASMTSSFAVGGAPGEASGLGLAHQLVGLPNGFATAVVQGAPAAVSGGTDVFAIEAHTGPRGSC